jgi:hypothetical protein
MKGNSKKTLKNILMLNTRDIKIIERGEYSNELIGYKNPNNCSEMIVDRLNGLLEENVFRITSPCTLSARVKSQDSDPTGIMTLGRSALSTFISKEVAEGGEEKKTPHITHSYAYKMLMAIGDEKIIYKGALLGKAAGFLLVFKPIDEFAGIDAEFEIEIPIKSPSMALLRQELPTEFMTVFDMIQSDSWFDMDIRDINEEKIRLENEKLEKIKEAEVIKFKEKEKTYGEEWGEW